MKNQGVFRWNRSCQLILLKLWLILEAKFGDNFFIQRIQISWTSAFLCTKQNYLFFMPKKQVQKKTNKIAILLVHKYKVLFLNYFDYY